MTRLMSWLVAAVLLALPAAAAELRDPAGAPMLEVRGAVTVHNRGDAAVFLAVERDRLVEKRAVHDLAFLQFL